MILFAHGLEGSPRGRKASAMREAGLDPVVPDLRGRALSERLAVLDELTREHRGDVLLVGSSYGGLAAALLAARHPERLRGLLLLAPALRYPEPPNNPGGPKPPTGLPVTVIHGLRDEVVPADWSRDYAARSPAVRLLLVDDGHRLEDSLDLVLAELRRLAGSPGGSPAR